MGILDEHTGLYTDYYELTMAQGYYLNGQGDIRACFDYFFRKNPFNGGYTVFAGLPDLLSILETFRFDDDACAYLKGLGFTGDFIRRLRNFTFRGDLFAVREGEVVFPYEPVLRVEGTLIETQLIETVVLNILNFESLVATKACRLKQAAGTKTIVDFGFRRAHGPGGIQAARAAVTGGAAGTSNVYSAFLYGLKPVGTMAHSWIQSFDDELAAFRKYAQLTPDQCVLLVDTYDTLKSGLPNAITVGRELRKKGHRLLGIRIDSGDLAYLSRQARKMLDRAGLTTVRIVASNQLDEYVIRSLGEQNAPIDIFGVGTRLVTGQPDAALDGVYKLSMSGGKPRLKISENMKKIILPGIKRLDRYVDGNGRFYADSISLEGEKSVAVIHHPHEGEKTCSVDGLKTEPLLSQVMVAGKTCVTFPSPEETAQWLLKRLTRFPDGHLSFENPHIYKVGISDKLQSLRADIIHEIRRQIGSNYAPIKRGNHEKKG